MPKITVHGGPSIAGAQVVGGAWSDTREPDEWLSTTGHPDAGEPAPVEVGETAAEPVLLDGGAVVVPDSEARALQTVGENEAAGSESEAQSETDDGSSAEQVSQPDYSTWTVEQLREELGNRGLTKSGNKTELAERLAQHDVDTADQALP